ncbi:hypothetical protein KTR66_19420 [Roseococcus sp. SDR]|uniref:hypothetical protein n=1 Tax=Roseococcus sp. SDR TaxID=2835532 RepID=UPI001BCB2D35|nr:hypothetical protein [Roseococcus sp. SDR]MBS7792178.1 hypothetical protein [Roseococcus sp. SDR]MBV1847492.1 hypothetical protein [Roseococcus sp. SDR]
MGALGTRQAASLRPAPQRQPIDIERLLVWVYRDQRADVVIDRGAGLYEAEAALDGVAGSYVSVCGCAAVARIQALGVRVDRQGRDAGALDPDAEVIHRAVMQLSDRVAGLPRSRLVIQNAATASRPDAMVDEVPRPIPILNREGRPAVEWLDKGRRFGVCRVDYQPSASAILAAREEYAAWHQALRLLAFVLQREPRVTKFHALSPAAPAAPWLEAR